MLHDYTVTLCALQYLAQTHWYRFVPDVSFSLKTSNAGQAWDVTLELLQASLSEYRQRPTFRQLSQCWTWSKPAAFAWIWGMGPVTGSHKEDFVRFVGVLWLPLVATLWALLCESHVVTCIQTGARTVQSWRWPPYFRQQPSGPWLWHPNGKLMLKWDCAHQTVRVDWGIGCNMLQHVGFPVGVCAGFEQDLSKAYRSICVMYFTTNNPLCVFYAFLQCFWMFLTDLTVILVSNNNKYATSSFANWSIFFRQIWRKKNKNTCIFVIFGSQQVWYLHDLGLRMSFNSEFCLA